MNRIIPLLSALVICSEVAAQNVLPRNFYGNHAELEMAAVERLRIIQANKAAEEASVYKFQDPMFFNEANALLAKASDCGGPQTDTIYTLAEDTFANLESRFFLDGWRYAVQDCWVFVNEVYTDASKGSDKEALYFQTIDSLQSTGLLKRDLIKAKLRGSAVVWSKPIKDATDSSKTKTITAFRLADLKSNR